MTTAAVILAAGFSTRMGAPNKLLMPVAGQPVLRSVVHAVLNSVDTVPLVVLGHEAEEVGKLLTGLLVDLVINPDPSRGQPSSVRLGLQQAPEAEATLVVLGDQPFLTATAIRRLLRAHRETGAGKITVPVSDTARGNPVVIPRRLRRTILAQGTKIGCGGFTRKHPELTHPFVTSDPAYFFDIDTPDDLGRARALAERQVAS